ncbi:1-acyl-sn-glycerol-3-phosphate acyltransferase [Myxosarcina sp. GI1]|uniref:lysophospholipid acyltransferase family protein n=1 Tax=Myxosarcina sp. GI1 TaxID=1541065 RepID=UPI00055B93BF|nr:1-acyl-sn-glycerol-3-phosphate acyltransferase [Myxosarcina sp. GI1]
MANLKQDSVKSNIDFKRSDSIHSHVSPWLARILYPLGGYLVLPFFFKKIVINGRQNIPKTGAILVAPTHRSRWDAVIVPTAVGKTVSKRDVHFMVTTNEVKGLQGWFIRHMGGFPVNTERPQIDSVLHSIDILQQDDKILVIFPEGNIFREDTIQPLKRGVASIALETKLKEPERDVNILPVSIRYNERYPTWGTRVKVDIGSPLKVLSCDRKSLRSSSQKLTKSLQARLQELYESQSA